MTREPAHGIIKTSQHNILTQSISTERESVSYLDGIRSSGETKSKNFW